MVQESLFIEMKRVTKRAKRMHEGDTTFGIEIPFFLVLPQLILPVNLLFGHQ
jgi:hypothetical protein